MKRALLIIAGVALMCGVTYLAWLNPGPVEIHLSPTYVVPLPLAAALVTAFLVGVLSISAALLIQGVGRSIRDWWSGRSERRGARADTLEHRGERLLWEGEIERGRSLLLRAWRRDPSHRRAALAAASSYIEEGDIAAAERTVRRALEQRRGDPDLLLLLSEACAREGDQTGAIQALEQVRAQHPRAARILRLLREQYVAAGRWSEAAAVHSTYLRTLSRPPQIASERERLVGLQYEAALSLAAPSDRISALGQLVEAHPTFVPAVVSVGDALVDAGRRDEALGLWEKSLRTIPRSILLERLVAHDSEPRRRLHWRQQLRKARSTELRPECVELWLARLQLLDGQAKEALAAVAGMATAWRDTAFAQQLRADALRQLGRLDEALKAYAAAVENGALSSYRCRVCGRSAPGWLGRCPECTSWDSYRSAVEIAAA